MTRSFLNYRFLMEESEHRIDEASRSRNEHERLVAQRILESEKRHRSWESSHYRLMKSVAEPYSVEVQLHKLKKTAIGLTHKQALFSYLRDNSITGRRRHTLFRAFYGPADYVNAVIAEHGHFLNAASSSICATHLSQRIWQEVTFGEALAEYEEAYGSYFAVYCDCIVAEAEQRELYTAPLLMFLKKEAMDKRSALLSAGTADSGLYPAIHQRRAGGPADRLNRQVRG